MIWPLFVLAGVLALAGAAALLWGRPCAVYWLWGVDRSRPLYIGKTVDVAARMDKHRREQPWWRQVVGPPTVRWYRSVPAAEHAEELAIGRDRPVYNDRFNRGNPHRVPVYRRTREGIRS